MTTSGTGGVNPIDLSFLAPPGEGCDWRMLLLFDAVCQSRLDDALADGSATSADLASRLGLSAGAVRVVLEALTAWSIVRGHKGGRFGPGACWPGRPSTAALRHQARAVRSATSSRSSPPVPSTWFSAPA